jgi:hypothetical protein
LDLGKPQVQFESVAFELKVRKTQKWEVELCWFFQKIKIKILSVYEKQF